MVCSYPHHTQSESCPIKIECSHSCLVLSLFYLRLPIVLAGSQNRGPFVLGFQPGRSSGRAIRSIGQSTCPVLIQPWPLCSAWILASLVDVRLHLQTEVDSVRVWFRNNIETYQNYKISFVKELENGTDSTSRRLFKEGHTNSTWFKNDLNGTLLCANVCVVAR